MLDKGFIELVDCMGNDLQVVNCARVSFSNESSEFLPKDARLIDYLSRNGHISPFYHSHLMFRVRAPISVQRQWFKHKIGTAENSESTRYIEVLDEFYVPAEMRAQSTSNKQGSSGALQEETETGERYGTRQFMAKSYYVTACEKAFENYAYMIQMGVAKEQAREVLPLCTYTSWIWTASLAAVAHFIKLRDEEHAQLEIREYAKAMRVLTEEHFPVSLKALLEV